MELLEQIVRAGVVGLGGAGFPTGKKLDCRVEWLIVNGAECEPLLRTDRYLMRHNAERVIRAAGAVARMVGAKHCVIALKRAYTQEWKARRAEPLSSNSSPWTAFILPETSRFWYTR